MATQNEPFEFTGLSIMRSRENINNLKKKDFIERIGHNKVAIGKVSTNEHYHQYRTKRCGVELCRYYVLANMRKYYTI